MIVFVAAITAVADGGDAGGPACVSAFGNHTVTISNSNSSGVAAANAGKCHCNMPASASGAGFKFSITLRCSLAPPEIPSQEQIHRSICS